MRAAHQNGAPAAGRWRRGCLLALLACGLALVLAGAVVAAEVRAQRLRLALPAEILSAGPLWVGDFCRYNVAQGRHPPGWCPRDYTVYVILSLRDRGTIFPLVSIPYDPPLPRASTQQP